MYWMTLEVTSLCGAALEASAVVSVQQLYDHAWAYLQCAGHARPFAGVWLAARISAVRVCCIPTLDGGQTSPDFVWLHCVVPQVLYERACDYLELDTRVEVLNARFQVGG
jgi:hypothetical protein